MWKQATRTILFKRPTSTTKSYHGEILSQELFTYDAYHLIAKTDAEGNVTTYTYDGAGRKISEELNGEQSEFAYDSLGRLDLVKQDQLLSVTEHDLLDRIVEERKEDLQGHVLSKIVYAYDNAGNKKTVTRFINGKDASEQFEYDSLNRLIKKEDPLGNITRTTFDDELHLQTTIDPLGLQTIEHFNSHYLAATIEKRSCQNEILIRDENAYDNNDNLIAKTTTLFHPKRIVTTLWNYGPLDQLLSQTEAAGTSEQKVTRYSYTPTGQLFQTIKPSSVVLTNTYDPLQHLLSQSSSDGTVRYTYQHNRLGHLIRSVDERNQTTLIRTFDPKGRLLSEKLSNNLFVCNHYDTQGRRVRLDLPDRSFISYEHDPLHLRSVTRYDSSGHLVYAHYYTNYDLAGNLLSETLIGNRDRVVHSYDLAGRPTLLTSPHFTHAILEYDAVGNVLRSELNNEILDYSYDDLYQLTSEKEHTYAHDSLYNRLQKDSASYAVNALNQLSSVFKYDEDGNPYSHGKARYTYDAFDRLISMEDHSTKLHFAYDSCHRRLSKTVYRFENGVWEHVETRFFLYDDQNEIGSVDAAGNIQELRILGRTPQAEIGSAIAIELQGKIFAPIHDLYGNVSMLLSLADKNHEHYCYTAFGEERNPSPTINPWRFSSKRIDDETGLVYFGRRYYLPTYGRWLTPDPLGLDAGPNLYAYVFNAPLTHVDLYGLFALNNSEDFKQTGIGAAHGLGHFALNTATAISTIGWGLTTPVRSMNWITGKSSFSQDWNSFQQSNRAFHDFGDRWMHRALPGNTSHDNFRTMRSGVNDGLEISSIFTGAGLAKGAISVTQKGFSLAKQFPGMQKVARPSASMTNITSRTAFSSGAENVNAGISLSKKLSQLETAQQFAIRSRMVHGDRIRYYNSETLASTPGPTRGRTFVTEFDSSKSRVRTWMECYDHYGVVNRVHPKQINGQNLVSPHYPPIGGE